MKSALGIMSLLFAQSVQALPHAAPNNNGVSAVHSTSTNATPDTTGSIHTSLETSGRESSAAFSTTLVFSPTATIQVSSYETLTPSSHPTSAINGNIFVPIATGAAPLQIGERSDYPETARGVGIGSHGGPLQTNKFYANFFLGEQTNPVWTHPYSVTWAKGTGYSNSWGLSISHIDRSSIVYGPSPYAGAPPQYYINPLYVQSIVLTAAELGPATVLNTDTHGAFSVNANLASNAGGAPLITFPLVQGMGFVTAIYNSASVLLRSGVFFTKLEFVGGINSNTTFKYRIDLADNTTWLLYATPNAPSTAIVFDLTDSTEIEGPASFQGTIQITKNPAGQAGEAAYDSAAGAYPLSGSVSATTNDEAGSYSINWQRAGVASQKLLMFALPHHVESMSPAIASLATPIQLATTSKGYATGFLTDSFELWEPNLPVDIGFEPWSPAHNNVRTVSVAATLAVNAAAGVELEQNMTIYTNLNSMYYSGKALSKYATITYAVNDFGSNSSIAAAGLHKLEAAFATFVNNQQQFPLVYDTEWGGIVSSASYGPNSDTGADFGNTLYNDHHFHYGYFVHAAAIIAYLDPPWLDQGTNKAWVNSLIRDYANPVNNDPYFPFSRSFDFYHGHSWAKGLFDSADGKDEESTSEDAFSLYAIKQWGRVIGDTAMEERGNLQLAILARSLKNYFYMTKDNTVQPPEFLPNMVSGILFENKLDHTTYFGPNTSFVEGIHMLPINPTSAYTRSTEFVSEEWTRYFSNGYLDTVDGGWKGILMANLAIIDPQTSFEFFDDPSFDWSWLDDGASRTWYLAYAAALGGG